MYLTNKKPKLWFAVKFLYKIEFNQITAFTFGNTIYAPKQLSNDFLRHEVVHSKQQMYSKIYGSICFVRYYFSKKYRFNCELEACRGMKDKQLAAKILSDSFYKQKISFEEALKLCE